jgi:hypothetical protein
MGSAQDVWRIRWQCTEGRIAGHEREGLWVLPYAATADAAVRDASIWQATSFTVPGDSGSYPVRRRVVVYAMDNGEPVELAAATVTRATLEEPFRLADGTEVAQGTEFDGRALHTQHRWTEAGPN